MAYRDGWWMSDGLRLHFRDQGERGEAPPVLCLPGLTRNARDFETLAERLSSARRVLSLEFRGRGASAPAADPMTYVPSTYVADVEQLLASEGIGRFIAIGTSLGGIVAMLLALKDARRLAGVVLNDIGPTIEEAGLQRIRGYVGRTQTWPTWVHAARALWESNGEVYPDWKLPEWLVFAKRLCRVNSKGRIVPDYDLRIAEPFRAPGGEAGADLWPALAALRDVPALFIRGDRSDILSQATLNRMTTLCPSAEAVTVPNVGHAPTLDEPQAVAAIQRLLDRAR